MKKIFALLLIALMMLSCVGCSRSDGKDDNESDVETVDIGDSRFLIVELEGSGANTAPVELYRVEKSGDSYADAEACPITHDGGFRYYALLPAGGTYQLYVTRPDGQRLTRLIVFEDSQVCSIHMSLDAKDNGNYRPLWPETPHNNPEPN
ncbi:MAG: hypothetical protein IJY28_09865 [Clostridia bacterium]|nr:hypothetical protein [Clostridia bacterium]